MNLIMIGLLATS